jgi:two-component system response regulator NreC
MSSSASQFDRRLRVLIADDYTLIRKHVRTLLEEYPGFEVCGEARDGAEAIEQAQRLKPDVILLNISMPNVNGFDAARVIKAKLPQSAIVILSANADERFIEEAKRVGARAYVAKTKAGEALINAIEQAVTGDDFILVS